MTDRLRELTGINEVLVPYADFDASDLARQLHPLVTANAELLTLRGIGGVITRYGNAETAEQKVRKGQAEHEILGHYAIVNTAGNVRGAASVDPRLPLKKQHVPLPPVLARGLLVDTYPSAGPNIHAWTAKEDTPLLTDAYKDLVLRTTGWYKGPDAPKAWTVEPTRSPQTIHQAITDGGLEKVATRRFEDGESRHSIPPRSTLYARLYGDWATAHGRQRELRTGAQNFVAAIDLAKEEIKWRGPRY